MAKNTQAEIHKIITLLKTGKSDIALKKAIAGAKKHPANPIFPQMAGAALVARKKPGAAAPHFHKSYKIKPDHEEFQDNLARSLISSGQIESADALLTRHAEARNNSATYHNLWALRHLHEKYFQKSADAASVALQLQAGQQEALLLRAKAFTDLLQSDRALLDFEAVLSQNPTHVEAMEGRASALASLGKVEEAKR
ncbi:MAG: tetratricopeptide repeat protein, partial [Hyphomicrobiales bacterium]